MNPAVAGDLVLVGSCAGTLYAFDRESGDVRWSYDTGLDGYQANFHGQPWIGDGAVVIGTDSQETGYVYALDRKTGALRWKHEVPAGVSTNVIRIGDAVFAVTLGDRVLALDLATGVELWVRGDVAQERSEYRSEQFQWTASPATDGKRLFWGSLAGALTALDPRTGDTLWTVDLGSRVSAPPIVSDGEIVLGTADGRLHRHDPASGKSLATLDLGQAAMFQITPFEGGFVILPQGAASVIAVDRKLSGPLWEVNAMETWSSFQPRVWKGALLIGDSLGELLALETETGKIRWQHTLEGYLRGLGDDGSILYVGNLGGTLFAVRPPE